MNSVPDGSDFTSWRKSSYCENADGACVEISDDYEAGAPIRDSKNPHGPAIVFSPHGWSTFVTAVKQAQFPAS